MLIFVSSLFINYYFTQIYNISLSHWITSTLTTKEFYIYFIPISLSLNLLFFSDRSRLLKKFLFFSFIFSSGFLNFIWYSNSTYTLKEESNNIENFSKRGTYMVGQYEYWLSTNNKNTIPLWYNVPGDIWTTIDRGRNKQDSFNNWFHEHMKSKYFLFLSKDYMKYINVDKDDKKHIKFLKEINLCPLPFTNVYRYKLNIYSVNNI